MMKKRKRLVGWDVEVLINGEWMYAHSCLAHSAAQVLDLIQDGTQLPKGATPEICRVKRTLFQPDGSPKLP